MKMDDMEKDRLLAGFLAGLRKDGNTALVLSHLLPYITKNSCLYAYRNLHPYDVLMRIGGLEEANLEMFLKEVSDRGCVVGFMIGYGGVFKSRAYAIYKEELAKASDCFDTLKLFQSIVKRMAGIRHRGRHSTKAGFKAYHGALMMSIHKSRLPGHLIPNNDNDEMGIKYRLTAGRDVVFIRGTLFSGFTSSQLMMLCGIWSVSEREPRKIEKAVSDTGKSYESRVRFRLRDLMMAMTGREWWDVSDGVRDGFTKELKVMVKMLNQSRGHVVIGREEYPLEEFFFKYAGEGIDFDHLTGNEVIVMDDPYGRRYVQSCGNVIEVPAGIIGSMRCDDFSDVCARLYIIYRVLVSRHLKSKSIDRREFEREFGNSYRLMRTTMQSLKEAKVVDEYGFTSAAIEWVLSPWGKEKEQK